jgi:hypothetical protein
MKLRNISTAIWLILILSKPHLMGLNEVLFLPIKKKLLKYESLLISMGKEPQGI